MRLCNPQSAIRNPQSTLRPGFTLLELIIALAVAAVAASMVVPAYSSWQAGQKLSESVDALRTNLVKARTRAMEEGRTYRFAFEPGSGTYRIAPDEFEDWPDLADSPAGPLFSDASAVAGFVQVDTLKDGVVFVPSPPGSETAIGTDQGPVYVLFRPVGTATILLADGSERAQLDLTLGNDQGGRRIVRVRAITGGSTVFIPGAQ